jgi:hypothetical protein
MSLIEGIFLMTWTLGTCAASGYGGWWLKSKIG